MYKVVLFKGIIDSLNVFADELADGFRNRGCEVLLVDVNDLRDYHDSLNERINFFINDKSAIVIFFNNIGMLMEDVNGGNYWNQSGVRCFDILVDPPFFYNDALCSDIKNVTFLCVDKDHADYINKYFGVQSYFNKETGIIRHAVFMPLAGVKADALYCNDDIDFIKPYEERGIDVIFTGNITNYKDIDTETGGLDNSLLELWDIVYEQIVENSDLTIEASIRLAMNRYNLALDDMQVYQSILLFKRMDSVIRARMRAKVVKALTDADIKVDVFGDGWEDFDTINPDCLVIHKKVSYKESVRACMDAKISLNVMPWFKRGFHDRIATAALSGCVSLTDASEYTQVNYIDGKDIIYYDLKDLDSLCKKVKYILANPDKAQIIACNGRGVALCNDTWQHRADFILKLAGSQEENKL